MERWRESVVLSRGVGDQPEFSLGADLPVMTELELLGRLDEAAPLAANDVGRVTPLPEAQVPFSCHGDGNAWVSWGTGAGRGWR